MSGPTDLDERLTATLTDDELRSWVIAYGPGRAWIGKPRRVGALALDDDGNALHVGDIELSPAFIYQCSIQNTPQGIARSIAIVPVELFEAEDGVIITSSACTFVPLRGLSVRDLAGIRGGVVNALKLRAAAIDAAERGPGRVALAGSADLAAARARGIIQ